MLESVTSVSGGGWQVSPYSLILGCTAALGLAVAVAVWRRRATPGAAPFALMLVATSGWAALAALEHASLGQAQKLLFARLEYLGIMSVGLLWLAFALAYSGARPWVSGRRLPALLVIPVLTVVLVLTNERHHLVWSSVVPSSPIPGAPLIYGHGPWFWVAAAFNYVLLVAGSAVLIASVARLSQPYQPQTVALLAGLALPWAGNAIYLMGLSPLPGADPTPLTFTLAGIVYALGVFRHGLFDLVPVARHAVVESMADGIVALDADRRVIDVNSAARRMLGLAGALVGEPVEAVLAAWPDLVARLAGDSPLHVELKLDVPDGARDVDLRTSPLRDGNGRTRGRLVVLSDVTVRKRTEEALQQNEKMASLGQLLAGVAHELNNPLAVIVGQVGLLRRQLASGPGQGRLEKIAAAAERCDRIIASFLSAARQQPPERRPTDINRVLRDAVSLPAYQLRMEDVSIVLDLADELPHVSADSQQLQQVVVNLVVNAQHAMRATDRPRQLTLRSWPDPEQRRVSFSVTDTGPGVPAALRERIFEPFYTTKPVGLGSGLGLSVCRGIVDSHNGAIRVDGSPGGGAVFVVDLPVVEPGGEHRAPEREEVAAIGRRARVLVVEDEPMVADLLADVLAEDGHHVETVADGRAALDRLSSRPFDVVVTDVKMPILDGPGLYREVTARTPDLSRRFLFVTGDTLTPETLQFLEESGARTLDKPFNAEVLQRAVQEVLRDS